MDEAAHTRIAELEAMAAEKDARTARLKQQVRELLERLNRNPNNSSKPPSSDPPSVRAGRQAKAKGKSGKKPGGQPGHKGTQRALVPPEQVDRFTDRFPGECIPLGG